MVTSLALASMLLAPPASEPMTQPDAAERFHLDFKGGVWLPRLDGFTSLGDAGTRLDFSDELGADGTETVPNFELTGQYERWSAMLSGFLFETDGSAAMLDQTIIGSTTVPGGATVGTNVDMTSAALELKYAIYQPLAVHPFPWSAPCEGTVPADDAVTDFRIGPTLGVRYLEVEQSFDLGGLGTEEADGAWLAVLGGLDMTLLLNTRPTIPFLRSLEIQGGLGLGPAFGGDGGFLWQVRAGLTARFAEHIGLSFGYRLLETDVEDDDFDFEGGLQGLFVGLDIGF